jgi:hypothetical protein
MKKFTFTFLLTFAFGAFLMAQMPVAITIEPADATAFDEITLTLDANESCPAEALFGAGKVMMHSGVTLDGAAWSNVVAFDGMGANGQYPELLPVMGALPPAISMSPRYAKATDTITITLDTRLSCPMDALYGADSVMIHSGVTVDGAGWSNVIGFDGMGANGQYPKMTNNGDSTWSITIVPAAFYGVETGEVTAINAVFNNGSWDAEGKDFDEEGGCVDFTIPLATGYEHTWSITFVPAEFYGIEEGSDVTHIDGVFNGGAWDLGEAKDFDVDMNCVDFKIPFGIDGINDANAVSFRMYPNPVENTLNIENLINADQIAIYNVVGERVISIDNIPTQTLSIETNNLTEGMYLISVSSNGNVETTKFIKK